MLSLLFDWDLFEFVKNARIVRSFRLKDSYYCLASIFCSKGRCRYSCDFLALNDIFSIDVVVESRT